MPRPHRKITARRTRIHGYQAAKPMPSRRTPADYFTGTVQVEPDGRGAGAARIRGAWVRFEPRARTAWHTHPLGQTLHVVSGTDGGAGAPGARNPRRRHGVDRARGEAPARRRARDHHGVPALQEALDGTHVTWLEHVTDEQYDAKGG